ncbi:MAG: hypothetical protein HFI93_09780 [Lachnospiraceae bacterium]|nr:hypothetical protein [Lachnospiraceae bacterium]
MNWIYKLQNKFGRYAIPGLMKYVIVLQAAGFALLRINPLFFYEYLCLDPAAVMHGQIWRLFTFLLQPAHTDFLYFLLYMYLYYLLGTTLEHVWGSFVFDLYIFIGVLGHILAAMVVYWLTGYNGAPYFYNLSYLYMSLFMAYAAMFPEAQFLLFFIIPIKAKWFAIAEGLFFLYGIIMGSMTTRIVALLSFANFIIFFLSMYGKNIREAPRTAARKASYQRKVSRSVPKTGTPRHRCAVCGRTELDDENLEFRYCSQCDGQYEYCMDHLYTHKHVKQDK